MALGLLATAPTPPIVNVEAGRTVCNQAQALVDMLKMWGTGLICGALCSCVAVPVCHLDGRQLCDCPPSVTVLMLTVFAAKIKGS